MINAWVIDVTLFGEQLGLAHEKAVALGGSLAFTDVLPFDAYMHAMSHRIVCLALSRRFDRLGYSEGRGKRVTVSVSVTEFSVTSQYETAFSQSTDAR
jgi:hypothetical protein